jgi:hypothetical protein
MRFKSAPRGYKINPQYNKDYQIREPLMNEYIYILKEKYSTNKSSLKSKEKKQ